MSGLLDAIGKLAGNSPAGVIAQGVGEVLDRVLPDPELKRQAQQQAFDLIANGTFADKAQQAMQLAQIDVDKADAQGASPMQRLWRPFMGWVGGLGLAYQWLLVPVGSFGYVLWTGHALPVKPPDMDPNLMWLIGSMLGINVTARTVEKVKGAA